MCIIDFDIWIRIREYTNNKYQGQPVKDWRKWHNCHRRQSIWVTGVTKIKTMWMWRKHAHVNCMSGIWYPGKPEVISYIMYCGPANTRRWPNVGVLLVHRLRRWTNTTPTLGQPLVFAGGLSLQCGVTTRNEAFTQCWFNDGPTAGQH